jgi:hypothetical protein
VVDIPGLKKNMSEFKKTFEDIGIKESNDLKITVKGQETGYLL